MGRIGVIQSLEDGSSKGISDSRSGRVRTLTVQAAFRGTGDRTTSVQLRKPGTPDSKRNRKAKTELEVVGILRLQTLSWGWIPSSIGSHENCGALEVAWTRQN